MHQESLTGEDLSALREAYCRKVHDQLPAKAQANDDWPIRDDHCFSRVVLDTVFEDVWYSHVDGRPAYEHLSPAELKTALEVADRMLREGRPVIEELNEQSLQWRDDRN